MAIKNEVFYDQNCRILGREYDHWHREKRMMVRTREFHNIYSDNHWIYSAYKYWFEHIRDPDVPCSTLEFPEWVEKTYNLEWYQFLTGVQITSYSDEDWIRFQLEWL